MTPLPGTIIIGLLAMFGVAVIVTVVVYKLTDSEALGLSMAIGCVCAVLAAMVALALFPHN